MEGLREREDERGCQPLPAPELVPGEPVMISDGLLRGYEAVFSARSGSERVLVLLHIAGKEVRVQVPAEHVAPSKAQR